MSTAYDKVVKTSGVVIKNNGILKKKLEAEDATIEKQLSRVNVLTVQLMEVEERSEKRKQMIQVEIEQKMEDKVVKRYQR